MGDCQKSDLRFDFNRLLKLKFLGSQVITDAGLLADRELDEALGLTALSADALQDSRLGRNKQRALLPLLRQSIYSRLAGWDTHNANFIQVPESAALVHRSSCRRFWVVTRLEQGV